MVVEFQLFDVWLFEHGLDARSLSELPSFSELCGDSPVPGILPAFLKAEQSNVKNGKKDPTPPAYFSEETAVQVDETLPCFTTPAQLTCETAKTVGLSISGLQVVA